MSEHMSAFDHKQWDEAGLQDFADFSEKVEYCNQSEYGDGQFEGDWYYIPDEPLAAGPHVGCRVIYSGTFGNYNSPGASSYTYANIYDCALGDVVSQAERKEFEKAKAKWESSPEYLESESDDEDEGEDEDEPEDEDEDE